MGHKHPLRTYPGGFPVPGSMAEEPGCGFHAYAPGLSRLPNGTGWNVNHPAGDLQFLAEFPYRIRIPPAFFRRSYTVLHMETPEPKALLLP
jgi:hypothetical protein